MKDADPEPFSAIADAILSSPAKAKADADGFGSPKPPRTPHHGLAARQRSGGASSCSA